MYKEDIPLFGHKMFFVPDSKNHAPYLRSLIWSCILGYLDYDLNSIWRNIKKKKNNYDDEKLFLQDEWDAMLLYLEGVGQIKPMIQ